MTVFRNQESPTQDILIDIRKWFHFAHLQFHIDQALSELKVSIMLDAECNQTITNYSK